MATTALDFGWSSAAAFTENDIVPRTETNSVALTEWAEKRYRVVVKRGAARAEGSIIAFPLLPDLPRWVEPTVTALMRLRSLGENWDSYGGSPVKPSVTESALRVLSAVMTDNSPAPSVVPLHDGGIQLEWHRRKQDLEIVFPADQSPSFFYCNSATGEQQEGGMSGLSLIADILHRLS